MEPDAIHELSAAYALDALDPADEQDYEEHLRHCRDCQADIASMRAAASSLAYVTDAPPPPPALRERILESARRERESVVPLVSRRRFRIGPTSALAAVAAVIALGLGIWSLSLSRTLDRERERVALLADPEARSISLAGAPGRLVVGDDGDAVLVVGGLRPAPAGKEYEIWVIEDGTPRPAGLFAGDDRRTIVRLTRPVPDDAQVAVTLEREGGVDAPTGKPLFAART